MPAAAAANKHSTRDNGSGSSHTTAAVANATCPSAAADARKPPSLQSATQSLRLRLRGLQRTVGALQEGLRSRDQTVLSLREQLLQKVGGSVRGWALVPSLPRSLSLPRISPSLSMIHPCLSL